MKNPSSFLPLLTPLFLAACSLPLAAGWPSPYVRCVGNGVYVANSTYQANLRRLAALVVADASAARDAYHYSSRSIGNWPNRLQATSYCPRRRDGDGGDGSGGSSCAACIAGAFLKVETECPYRREAVFISTGNCTLELGEFRFFAGFRTDSIFEGNILKKAIGSGLILQAIGFACLFFLLFQEWCSRKRGNMIQSTPVLSGD